MTAAARTLVQTTTPGWFIDASDPDGGRVRKAKDGSDTIVSREAYEDAKLRAEALDVPIAVILDGGVTMQEAADASVPSNGNGAAKTKADATQERNAEHRQAAAKADLGVLTSGKPVKGRTTTIRCAWVDPAARTKKQAALFESGFEGVAPGGAYDAVIKAAGGADGAMPDGREVTIHVQDLFQVRFHPDNQRKHRNELRRRHNKAKTAARKGK